MAEQRAAAKAKHQLTGLVPQLLARMSRQQAQDGAGLGATDPADVEALLTFFNVSGGPAWRNFANWTEGDPCTNKWFGVTCICVSDCAGAAPVYKVSALQLGFNQVGGKLPDCLSALTELQVLHLHENRMLTGAMPKSWGPALTKLRSLTLNHTWVTGALEPSWGQMSALQELNMQDAGLCGGPIPSEWAGMRSLQYLDLSENSCQNKKKFIQGSLPPEWGNGMQNLMMVDISNAHLSGGLPDSWTNMSALAFLSLSFTGLSGTLPATIGQLSRLENLILADSNIDGPLPDSLSEMVSLRSLEITSQSLSGPLPSLNKAVHLNGFYVSGSISGALPSFAGTALTSFSLQNTQIHGPITGDMFPSTLRNVVIVGNKLLDGPFPDFGHCSRAYSLLLNNNAFNGTVPVSLAKLNNVISFVIGKNQLSGSWAPEFQSFLKHVTFLCMLDHNPQLECTPTNWTIAKGCYEAGCKKPAQVPLWRTKAHRH